MTATKAILDTIEQQLDEVDEVLDAYDTIGPVVREHKRLAIASVVLITAGVALAAGTLGWQLGARKTRLKYEDILTEEIAAAKAFHSRLNKEGEFATPASAVEALVPGEVVEAMSSYQGESGTIPYHRPSDIPKEVVDAVEVVETTEVRRNVFVDSVRNPNVWDYDTELASRSPEHPYVISFEEFEVNEPQHEQSSLAYYAGDDTLADERDQMIENQDHTVGDDNLLRFGHGSHDPRVVYIRNEKTGSDYEVVRSEGTYSKEVLGFDDTPVDEIRHSHRRARRARRTDE